MKVLLVGNYGPSRQESMQRFTSMLKRALERVGVEVRVTQPTPLFGRLVLSERGAGKWLGYIDRFLLFRLRLRRESTWADVVHVCDQGNAVYVPWLKDKPHVLTCHDMLAIRSARGEIAANPTGVTGRILQRWIMRGMMRARYIACVSHHTRQDVIRLTDHSATHVSVVANALNYEFTPMSSDAARDRFRGLGLRADARFFLHVGGNQWYKNRPGVIRIFAELVKLPAFRDASLVLAGKPMTEEIREAAFREGISERIVALTSVSNEDLCALYSVAEALLFPSIEEGFGWPIIEAQACGCPVVTTNRPPMTDIAGQGAVLVDPTYPAVAAQRIAASADRREALVRDGFANADRFSVEAMAQGYVKTYEQALSACEYARESAVVV